MLLTLTNVRDEATVTIPGWKWNEINRVLERLQRREYERVHPSPDEPTPIFDALAEETR